MNGWFPETSPIIFSIPHFRVLHACLKQPNGVLQSELVKKLKINKSTLSKTKSDLIRLGWCKDVQLYPAKEIIVKLCKINEIKSFLRQWEFLKKAFLIRPHSINFKGFFDFKRKNFDIVMGKLVKEYDIQIFPMFNNSKYIVNTKYGKIEFHKYGKKITFWVKEFVIPIQKEDLDFFEDYIIETICNRLNAMVNILREMFFKSRITIHNHTYLKGLHVGIILKEDINKILSLKKKLAEYGLYMDESIYGCHEFESGGRIDFVLEKIKFALSYLFDEM